MSPYVKNLVPRVAYLKGRTWRRCLGPWPQLLKGTVDPWLLHQSLKRLIFWNLCWVANPETFTCLESELPLGYISCPISSLLNRKTSRSILLQTKETEPNNHMLKPLAKDKSFYSLKILIWKTSLPLCVWWFGLLVSPSTFCMQRL